MQDSRHQQWLIRTEVLDDNRLLPLRSTNAEEGTDWKPTPQERELINALRALERPRTNK